MQLRHQSVLPITQIFSLKLPFTYYTELNRAQNIYRVSEYNIAIKALQYAAEASVCTANYTDFLIKTSQRVTENNTIRANGEIITLSNTPSAWASVKQNH